MPFDLFSHKRKHANGFSFLLSIFSEAKKRPALSLPPFFTARKRNKNAIESVFRAGPQLNLFPSFFPLPIVGNRLVVWIFFFATSPFLNFQFRKRPTYNNADAKYPCPLANICLADIMRFCARSTPKAHII